MNANLSHASALEQLAGREVQSIAAAWLIAHETLNLSVEIARVIGRDSEQPAADLFAQWEAMERSAADFLRSTRR